MHTNTQDRIKKTNYVQAYLTIITEFWIAFKKYANFDKQVR